MKFMKIFSISQKKENEKIWRNESHKKKKTKGSKGKKRENEGKEKYINQKGTKFCDRSRS